jgi:hypothetical protein
MAKSDFIRIAMVLVIAAVCAGESIAVAPGEPNPSASEPGALVNKAGVKPATTVVSKGGRVFLTRSVPSIGAATSQRRIHGKAATARGVAVVNPKKPEETSSQAPASELVAPVAQGPAPEAEPSPRVARNTVAAVQSQDSAPPAFETAARIELNGQRAAGANFLPPLHQAPMSSELPGHENPSEPGWPEIRTTEPVPLADRAPALPAAVSGSHGMGGGGMGALPAASALMAPGVLSSRWSAARWQAVLPWYGALAVVLVFLVGKIWIYSLHTKPWRAYTEDWSDGFLWRWDWKNARITNLRCFCPTCRNAVTLCAVAPMDSPPRASAPQGTWALCPHCKEATCLETSDVSESISRTLIHRVNSGEYRETVAASKRRAGVALQREMRIKTVGGRVL